VSWEKVSGGGRNFSSGCVVWGEENRRRKKIYRRGENGNRNRYEKKKEGEKSGISVTGMRRYLIAYT